MNYCSFIGNLGKDPEIREVAGSKVASFSIAVTEKGFTTKDGKKIEDKTTWVNIVAWKGLASLIGYASKGSKVFVSGKLSQRSYEKDGRTFSVYEIIAESITLLDSNRGTIEPTGNKSDDGSNLPF